MLLEGQIVQQLNSRDLTNETIERLLDYVYSELIGEEEELYDLKEIVEIYVAAQVLSLTQLERLANNFIHSKTTSANVLDLVDLCHVYELKVRESFGVVVGG